MSPPAVTRIVAELESRLGVQLFVRTTRSVSLTQAGKHYLDDVKPLLAGLLQAEETVRSEQIGLSGRLRINAPLSFGMKYLPATIAQFRILHPALSIELTLDDGFIDILQGAHDMAIRISEPPKDKSTIWRKFCRVPRLLVASRAYLDQHGMPETPADLKNQICLGYGAAGRTPVWRLRKGRDTAEISTFTFNCNNGDILADLSAMGGGITLLPRFIVAEQMKAGRLVQVMPDWQAPEIWLTAYYPPYTVLPGKVKIFSDFIANAVANESFG